jgi:hypothetical protein
MEFSFILLILAVAFLYASIGHGGASGYLALMALFSIEPEAMRSSALTLNLFVAGIAFAAYYKGGFYRARILLPFILTSIPTAFAGATISIDPRAYKIILGIFLLLAVLRMLLIKHADKPARKDLPIIPALLIGAGLGFLSGMIGIGGGIILSPILILLGWADVKQAAAASALFIFLNSLSGLFGVVHTGYVADQDIAVWIVAAVCGGSVGALAGSFRFSFSRLRYILAIVLIMAGLKLFLL